MSAGLPLMYAMRGISVNMQRPACQCPTGVSGQNITTPEAQVDISELVLTCSGCCELTRLGARVSD